MTACFAPAAWSSHTHPSTIPSRHHHCPTATMGDTVPTKLKSLQLAAFAKRAAQLEKFKPIVTYWREYRVPRVQHTHILTAKSALSYGAEDHCCRPPLGRPGMQCLHGRADGETGASKGPEPPRRRHSRRRRRERILRTIRTTDISQGRQGHGREQGYQVRSAATVCKRPC
jgi:hypothetical protein